MRDIDDDDEEEEDMTNQGLGFEFWWSSRVCSALIYIKQTWYMLGGEGCCVKECDPLIFHLKAKHAMLMGGDYIQECEPGL